MTDIMVFSPKGKRVKKDMILLLVHRFMDSEALRNLYHGLRVPGWKPDFEPVTS